ncbi:unnamed protein product [Phytophthora fragariaefolia]|uniref:Unnamed protein product n=1 Tax=Phytophthora fragariaefolia TaxID=1490495 RepID=A0A9W6YGL6_9STRA|nr:unnamed protein product [Phytophthora fragariaefolia]
MRLDARLRHPASNIRLLQPYLGSSPVGFSARGLVIVLFDRQESSDPQHSDMHYATTAKMMERSIMQQHFRRQTLSLFKRQCSAFAGIQVPSTSFAPISARLASTTAIHPPKHDEPSTKTEPTNATNEPAYKAHFKLSPSYHPPGPPAVDGEPIWENPINHAVYDLDKITTMEQTHHPIVKMHERVAYVAVKALRTGFDILSGYRGPGGAMSEKDWLNRCLTSACTCSSS